MALSEASSGNRKHTIHISLYPTTDNNQNGMMYSLTGIFSCVRWHSTYNSVIIIASHIPSKDLVAMLVQHQFQSGFHAGAYIWICSFLGAQKYDAIPIDIIQYSHSRLQLR